MARPINEELNWKDKRYLVFVGDFVHQHNYNPSYREISAGLNLGSTSYAKWQAERLVRLGYLWKADKISRSISFTEAGKEFYFATKEE